MDSIKSLQRIVAICATVAALFGMALMLIGQFTMEWNRRYAVEEHWEC